MNTNCFPRMVKSPFNICHLEKWQKGQKEIKCVLIQWVNNICNVSPERIIKPVPIEIFRKGFRFKKTLGRKHSVTIRKDQRWGQLDSFFQRLTVQKMNGLILCSIVLWYKGLPANITLFIEVLTFYLIKANPSRLTHLCQTEM